MDSERLAPTEVPGEFLDVTGHQLRRRLNISLLLTFIAVLLLIGVLVCGIRSNVRLNGIGATSTNAAAVSSASLSSPSACPSGLPPLSRKWIVLGDGYLRSSNRWSDQLVALMNGQAVDILRPSGNSLLQQLQALDAQRALGNSTQFGQWTLARESLTVFVSYGYVQLLATLQAQPQDPRSLSLSALDVQVRSLLQADWLDSSRHRLVVVAPALAYSPASYFLPSATHVCSDPLLAALYNSPPSVQTPQLVQLASQQAQNAYSVHASETAANVQIVAVDALLQGFTFGAAESAFADDCLQLNDRGQALLARYLSACLAGQNFDVPSSLNQR